ncbi:hypothetical protein, partial [Lacticaseibacillus paracasei]|uniref:hypothetical protein n=1 Tax=Lacticaseibacillus paracasei TaxID=1597 RepID=UPI00321B340B
PKVLTRRLLRVRLGINTINSRPQRIALRTPVFSSKSTQLANTIIVHLNFISRVNVPKLSRKPHFPKHGT